jgi:glutamate/aspartate transport system permease protein
MNYNWNWGIFFEASPEGTGTYADMLLSGLAWTIVTALCSWVIAFLLGSLVGVMRTLPNRAANAVGTAYVELFRNIPLLVQMFLWYFVLPEVLPEQWGSWLKQLPNAPFYTAVLCLGFFTASRVAEQVRAGIQSLPRGQKMAGTALGLTAYRIILPPLTSEFLNNLKNTSVALTIGLLELTARARAMQEFSFQVFEAFTAATILYVLINVGVIFISSWIERRVAVPGSR